MHEFFGDNEQAGERRFALQFALLILDNDSAPNGSQPQDLTETVNRLPI